LRFAAVLARFGRREPHGAPLRKTQWLSIARRKNGKLDGHPTQLADHWQHGLSQKPVLLT